MPGSLTAHFCTAAVTTSGVVFEPKGNSGFPSQTETRVSIRLENDSRGRNSRWQRSRPTTLRTHGRGGAAPRGIPPERLSLLRETGHFFGANYLAGGRNPPEVPRARDGGPVRRVSVDRHLAE